MAYRRIADLPECRLQSSQVSADPLFVLENPRSVLSRFVGLGQHISFAGAENGRFDEAVPQRSLLR